MKTYNVLFVQTKSAKIQINAENAEEAEEAAFMRFMDCEIELEDSGIPYDVDIFVSESGALNAAGSDKVSVYWNDLTLTKQAEILAAFGDNCNYDVSPIVEIPIKQEDDPNEA